MIDFVNIHFELLTVIGFREENNELMSNQMVAFGGTNLDTQHHNSKS